MRASYICAAAGALALLAGCGQQGGEGGVTADESKQLNEAAEMLDASPDSLVAPDETGLGNGDAGANGVNTADTGSLPVSDGAATNAQ